MRGLSWARTSNDDAILEEMYEYAIDKNGCYCMFPSVILTVNKTHCKRIYVNITAKTRMKESLAYYALCNIAQNNGAYPI